MCLLCKRSTGPGIWSAATSWRLRSDRYGRSLSRPTYVAPREPFAVPDWAPWFVAELKEREEIRTLLGMNCTPCIAYGTKTTFLRWISTAVKRQIVLIPEENDSIHWELPTSFGSIHQLDSSD